MHTSHELIGLGRCLQVVASDANGGYEKAVLIIDLGRPGAFDALYEDTDVSVGQANRLDDVADCADRVDVRRAGLVDGSIMLRGKKDTAVTVESLFEGADGRLTTDHKGRHHLRKDHHLADGHHREFAKGAVV